MELIPPSERPVATASPSTPWLQAAASGVVARLTPLAPHHLHESDRWGGALTRAAAADHVAAVRWLVARLLALVLWHLAADGCCRISVLVLWWPVLVLRWLVLVLL